MSTIKAEWTNADALDLQPTCNQLATDTISRQAAIDAVYESAAGRQMLAGHKDLITILKAIPSAQPESCGDVISREYLKEHIEACWINGRPRHAPELNELLSWIDDVPSARPDSSACWGCNCPKMEQKTFSEMVRLHDAERRTDETQNP